MAEDKKILNAWELRKAASKPANDDAATTPAEDALALRFTDQHEAVLRYVAAWSRWMRWDGAKWAHDDTLHVFDMARSLCRAAGIEADNPRARKDLRSAKTIAAVERLARADRRHAATVSQWDADPWLLNTPRGVIDLRTGDLMAHDPARHMTKVAAVTPFGDCPLWMAFLAKITAGDVALQKYLQRMCGYALTGLIKEHALFFAYGTGANGKGTFLNTITSILADYAVVSSVETFTAQTGNRHLTELARLHGARLVIAQETEEGKTLAEARIKAITGGDPITANFMRQDHFTFNPQFKLMIAGNHKPALRHVDVAMRRRFNLIPFTVTIPGPERDADLADKLRAEWPGILQWMVEGCVAWQTERLAAPATVLDATEGYFEAQDTLAQWMDECCRVSQWAAATAGELFKSWSGWAKARGEIAGSQKSFSGALEGRGFASKKSHGSMRVNGLGLKIDAAHSETEDERA